MKESDWRIFNKIKDKATEKFCTDALNQFREAMNNESSLKPCFELIFDLSLPSAVFFYHFASNS
ncbi:MAG: hypothetical protein ACJAWS_002275 [Oleiphilaceae bacterium]|jgi:hypothetical protein